MYQQYIHYSHEKFDRNLFVPILNKKHWSKPKGGFWASQINAGFGWFDWCAVEEETAWLEGGAFTFHLKESSNTFEIHNYENLKMLPSLEQEEFHYYIDFEYCLRLGIDAIELCWYGNEFKDQRGLISMSNDLHYQLYGWDCDSILIMNPDIVVMEDKL